MTPMTEAQANAVWDVLVTHAGASDEPHQREAFVYHLTNGCTEWRFMGLLGFGGKLYVEPRRLRVGCYPADLGGREEQVIAATNAALAELKAGVEP